MKRIVVFMMAMMLLSGGVFAAEQKSSDVVARVNGSKITKTYINRILKNEAALLPEEQRTQENLQNLAGRIINQRIDELLILDAAKKAKITVSSQEVKKSADSIKKNFKTDADFNTYLKKQDLTKAQFDAEVKNNLIRVKYISQEMKKRAFPPEQEELNVFYNAVVSKINGDKLKVEGVNEDLVSAAANNLQRVYGEQAKVRQIFVRYSKDFTKEEKKSADEKIKNLKKELSGKNVNFAQLSEKYSDDAALRQKRGDIGYVSKEDLTPEVAKLIFGLNVGAYNKSPLKTGNGYHFFRVEEKKASMPIEFNDVKQYLSDTIYKQSIQNEYDKMINEMRAAADIKFY